MKIALYVASWPPGRKATGIVTYTAQLVPEFKKMGHEVFILTHDTNKKVDTEKNIIDLNKVKIPFITRLILRIIYVFSNSYYNYLIGGYSLKKSLQELKRHKGIEIVEIEESFGWNKILSKKAFIPVLVRLHGPWFQTGKFNDSNVEHKVNKGRAKREGIGIKSAHYITANCNETLNSVKSFYKLDLPHSKIIPTPLNAVSKEEKWQINKCDKNSILFVGRFDSLKGGDLVLQAFNILLDKNQDLNLTFIGPDVGLKIENEVVHFEEYVKKNFSTDFRKHVNFHGQMNHSDLMALRTKHFITVIAAQYDTMGYMLLEPMSYGCPIISTAVGGIPEVIKDKHNGLLVPSQDIDALAAACQSLISDKELTASIAHQAWLDCKEKYSAKTVASKTIDTYQEAIDKFKQYNLN